jgi:hypothetical protein
MGVRFISDVALSANRVIWMSVCGERNRSRQEQTRGRISMQVKDTGRSSVIAFSCCVGAGTVDGPRCSNSVAMAFF